MRRVQSSEFRVKNVFVSIKSSKILHSALNTLHSNKGSTLLEVLVSLALVLFVVTALTLTTINGLKNSQLSQNQLQATKFAQEGVEQVKQARERNCEIHLTADSTPYVWYGPGQSIYSRNLGADFKLNVPGVRLGSLPRPVCSLDQVTADEVLESKFNRKITIQDDVTVNKKRVIVRVSWTDFSGPHTTEVVTVLSEEY